MYLRVSEATRGKNIYLRAEYLYVLVGSTPPPATKIRRSQPPRSCHAMSKRSSMLKKAWTDANSHTATLEQARAEAVSSSDALRAQLSTLEQTRAQAVSGADALRAAQPRCRCQTALERHLASPFTPRYKSPRPPFLPSSLHPPEHIHQ
jgi:hypothetical protein